MTNWIKWTDIAKECYYRSINGKGCNGCYFNTFFSKDYKTETRVCQMKKTVIELIRNVGVPENE